MKPDPVSVVLTTDEVTSACAVGCLRNWTANAARNHKVTRNAALLWGENIEGAAAEIAVARYVGYYWTGSVFDNDQNRADVGARIGVRWTRYSDGCLILKESDHRNLNYVLVTGSIPNFQIRGYISGTAALGREGFLRHGHDQSMQYWLPQSELKPIPEEWINQEGRHSPERRKSA